MKSRIVGAVLTLVGMSHPVLAELGPRRTTELVTLYGTTGLSVSCGPSGENPSNSLAIDLQVDPNGNLVPFVVPIGRKLIITGAEYRVVTDARRDVSVAIYSSQSGSPRSGHPLATLTSRASDEGGNIGVAVQTGSWASGIVLSSGHRPCMAEITGAPIHKDPGATGVHGFAYVLLHGYLTR